MKFVRILASLAALAAVSACATPSQVSQVQDVLSAPAPEAGTPFTKALFDEYKDATRHEVVDEGEWRHAAAYAEKAQQAAKGVEVQPEDPANWDVPAQVLPELKQARATLMDDFDKGARQRVPALAAKAQVSLDCWIEEEWERENDPGCKQRFLATEPKLKVPEPVAEPAPALPAQPLVIHFDYNKADINASAMQILYDAAPALKAAKAMVIRVHGFTDTMGGKTYNKSLSERRAKAVADQLKKLGVEGVTVEIVGFGKDVGKLAVPTKDKVKEARNRRAEVTWEPRR